MSSNSSSLGVNKAQSGFHITLSWRQKALLATIVNLACFFTLWQLVTTYGGVPDVYLPKFTSILLDFPKMMKEGILLPNLWVSVENYLIGTVIGVLVGLPLAFAIGGFKIIDRIFSPYIWALFSTPRIILVPLVFLWFGITNNARLAIVIISVIPSFVVVVMEGIKTTNNSLLRVARSFGANRWQLFKDVILPSSIPTIGTGLRQGMLRGLIGLYVGELFITTNGLGSVLSLAKMRFESARMFAILFVFIAFAVTTMALSHVMESKLTRWKTSLEI